MRPPMLIGGPFHGFPTHGGYDEELMNPYGFRGTGLGKGALYAVIPGHILFTCNPYVARANFEYRLCVNGCPVETEQPLPIKPQPSDYYFIRSIERYPNLRVLTGEGANVS